MVAGTAEIFTSIPFIVEARETQIVSAHKYSGVMDGQKYDIFADGRKALEKNTRLLQLN